MNRFRLFSILLLTSLVTTAASAQRVINIWEPPFREGIAAIAEDEVITFQQIRREMGPIIPRIRSEARSAGEFEQRMSELYLEILQSLVDRALIVKAFNDKEEWQIPQTYVEDEFDRIITEDFNNDRAQFLAHLRDQGTNALEFRRDLENRIIVSVMRGQQRRSQSEISPERIEAFYNENRIHFYQEESVHLRLIMLEPYADESPDLMRQTAERIMNELETGAAFEELAQQFSQDSRAERGGDWGWINRTDLREDLSEIAFTLQPGSHSDPILVSDRTFILYVEDMREEGIQPLEEVRDRIENILGSQIARQAQRQWLERLREDAYVRYF